MSFAGYRLVDSVEELRALIAQYANRPSNYYFLRWPHCVSGMKASLPNDFPSPEGQMFNTALELRWKRQGEGYSLLLLSETLRETEGFTAIPGDWEAINRSAQCHESKETQYPKGFHFGNGIEPKRIQQRYFRDRNTATIHFVALTIAS
ncbi:hypothetical protein H6F51_04835 [Cyanobacteria bacterium FACHB-DQ100]|nr:hypothetical protein [Cyanobacteria bacterium FACHB-DQ100]